MSVMDTLRWFPFDWWVFLKSKFRRRYARVSWKEDVPHVTIPDDVEVLEESLRAVHWEGTADYSLYYDGEVVNMRRPIGRDVDGTLLEDHLRARRAGGRIECTAHREPSRWEEKRKHVRENRIEWLAAEEIGALLEESGFPGYTIEAIPDA